MENAIFTEADRLVLRSYITMLDGLAAYLGDDYEFVLYSLEDMQRSVIKILNGHYTGRDVSAPISGMAMSILDHFQKDGGQEYVYYTTNDKTGKQLRFTAMAIRGEGKRIIGLLCINSYLHAPQQDVLENYFENPAALSCLVPGSAAAGPEEFIRDTTLQIKQKVEADAGILPSLKNKEIVAQLEAQGIFRLKDAVARVAQLLGVSKNTVYMHLRSMKQQ